MAAWMVASTVFALLLGIAAVAAERALRTMGRQARGAWLFALVGAIGWPAIAPTASTLLANLSGSHMHWAAAAPQCRRRPGTERWAVCRDGRAARRNLVDCFARSAREARVGYARACANGTRRRPRCDRWRTGAGYAVDRAGRFRHAPHACAGAAMAVRSRRAA